MQNSLAATSKPGLSTLLSAFEPKCPEPDLGLRVRGPIKNYPSGLEFGAEPPKAPVSGPLVLGRPPFRSS